jgi:hypothetical protein
MFPPPLWRHLRPAIPLSPHCAIADPARTRAERWNRSSRSPSLLRPGRQRPAAEGWVPTSSPTRCAYRRTDPPPRSRELEPSRSSPAPQLYGCRWGAKRRCSRLARRRGPSRTAPLPRSAGRTGHTSPNRRRRGPHTVPAQPYASSHTRGPPATCSPTTGAGQARAGEHGNTGNAALHVSRPQNLQDRFTAHPSRGGKKHFGGVPRRISFTMEPVPPGRRGSAHSSTALALFASTWQAGGSAW